MDLFGTIRTVGPKMSAAAVSSLAAAWKIRLVSKNSVLVNQGEASAKEFVVLDGRVVSRIGDSHGRSICVDFYKGPGLITPHVARNRGGASLVSLEITADAIVGEMDTDRLTEMMLQSYEIREWANFILRNELERKTDREWCLAALAGADRLRWFRDRYCNYEDQFPHSCIASFLGMTPVTLSRLRKTS